ncbi:trypsin-like serine peptidase [Lysobacter niastensis]|uniref:Trypsin-like peptidase domain-containing protein n=1 Tax=Lysobacter niastensis TaxID=380629 RepID=A0ABS0B5L1_9GAMM|nr:trypsin-like peptidase domain-containing protein [Lysobacter niastensis]MBF6024098.1 trypsin-like peptidase domain-containing protein [Lysobacter niastensis]
MALLTLPLPLPAFAQDPSPEQRTSTRALERELQRRPQGVTVPAEITKRGGDLVLQTADAAVPVANSEFLGQQVRQLPVEAVVSQGPDDSVNLVDVKLQATKRWESLPAGQRRRFGNVDTAQRKLSAAADTALKPDSTEADLRQLKQAVDDTREQVLLAYKAIPSTQRSEQRILVEQHGELRRAEKSLYGFNRDDRYPPQAYERIYANSHGAFALRVKGADKPRCSAVLIGEALGLTNNHCILEELPGELEAVFDYEDDLDGNHLTSQVFPIGAVRLTAEEDRDNLDFVLLRLEANADGKLPGSVYPVQCLSMAHVRRDDPLYVIGFPLGEPRTVHDNTFVYFPYRVSENEYAELEMLVRQEFDSLQAEEQSYIDGKLKEFTDSYRKMSDAAGATHYEYISVRFANQPTIGADSDTYHGNSGSPVYSRRSHAVIGLLFDGQEDLSQPWEPGWRSHEAILPITRVVERLDVAEPTWRADPKVCIRPAS